MSNDCKTCGGYSDGEYLCRRCEMKALQADLAAARAEVATARAMHAEEHDRRLRTEVELATLRDANQGRADLAHEVVENYERAKKAEAEVARLREALRVSAQALRVAEDRLFERHREIGDLQQACLREAAVAEAALYAAPEPAAARWVDHHGMRVCPSCDQIKGECRCNATAEKTTENGPEIFRGNIPPPAPSPAPPSLDAHPLLKPTPAPGCSRRHVGRRRRCLHMVAATRPETPWPPYARRSAGRRRKEPERGARILRQQVRTL